MTFAQKRGLMAVAILVVAIAISAGLSGLRSGPESEDPPPQAPLVDVQRLAAGSYDFTVETQGTVMPLTETVLSAEVSGSIVSVSPKFLAGGIFAADEELMRIDQTNYRGAVDFAEALVKQRRIEYEGAKSLRVQGYRAEAELAQAEAALADAEASLIRARRDLDRTRIRLPYAGMVRSRSADLGQFVNIGRELGVVFATAEAEVRLPLTDQDLAFVDLPDAIEQNGAGPEVVLRAIQRGRTETWRARIVRSEGVVDERARVTYAVARISDPYRRTAEPIHASPLPIGTFVNASIAGASIDVAVRIPRSSLRRNNEIILVDAENRLRLTPVTVVRADSSFAYVAGDQLAGSRLVLTPIESPLNGMELRITGEDTDDADGRQLAADTAPE